MILVTGGTGFLGLHVLQYLVANKQKIRATYRGSLPTHVSEVLKNNIEWVVCDITDVQQVEDAIRGCTHVYHCASTVSFQKKEHATMMYNNVIGTANIVNECILQQIKKLVHVSSVAALGRSSSIENITEKTDWEDSRYNSAYAESKYLAEMEVWRGIGEGLHAVIVNPAIILGEGNWNIGSSHLFKTVYNQFAWYTHGSTAWVDVHDVVKAMVILMESDTVNERYILSTGNYSYKNIFTKMALAMHKKPPHIFAPPWLIALLWRLEALKTFFIKKNSSITKETAYTAQQIFNYSNTKFLAHFPTFVYTPIDDTIKRCCAYYVNQQS